MVNTRTFKFTHQVDGVNKPIIVINPQNLLLTTSQVASPTLKAADGQTPLMVTKTTVNFPNMLRLDLEESIEEAVAIFEGGIDASESPIAS